ncbi:MAG: C25 family cysteine peptidase [Bacteroidales bacterium]
MATCGLRIIAQHSQQVELSFHMGQFQIVPSGEDQYRIESSESGFYYSDNPDLPALPLRSIRLLVPNGAELTDYDFEFNEEMITDNITLSKVQMPVPTRYQETTPPDRGAFTGSYPDRPVEYLSTMVQRGYTWFSFRISPFRYIGERQELSLVSKIRLNVEYQVREEQTTVIRPEKAVIRSLKTKLDNPEDLDRYYPAEERSLLKTAQERVDYLIVTTEKLRLAFEPLIEWKIRKGFKAEIKTLDEIEKEYNESNIQLKIKRCLYDYYVNADLKWVLLGGDHDVVPVQGCYSKVMMGKYVLIDESIPTDLFYACFDDRFDWNSVRNEKIGEAHFDGHDLLPEVYISRTPVRTKEMAAVFVEKTLGYEINQPSTGFSDKMLLAGVRSWGLWDGKSDSHHRSEFIYGRFIAKNFIGTKAGFFDTGTDFTGGSQYDVTTANLSEQLNEGYGIFHFAGHGNNQSLLMETGLVFDVDHAFGLINPVSGLVLSNSCDVNAFDSIDPCLSEAFIRNPHGGCVAFFGSSRYGFGNPAQSNVLGPSLQYNASFLKYLFSKSQETRWNSFATIASLAKSDYAHYGQDGGIYLYLLYAINPIGDPELPIYTENPSVFSNIRIYRIGNSLVVNTGGVRGSRICVTSLDLDEGFQQVVEGVSFHTFEEIPETFQVTVTAPDHIPYTYVSGSLTGLGENIMQYIRVYPNPVKEFLQLDFGFREGHLQVFDARGRMIREQELFFGTNRVDMSACPEGAYLLRFASDQGYGWHKVLK